MKIVLTDDVLACVEVLVESVEQYAATVERRDNLSRSTHIDGKLLMGEKVIGHLLHVENYSFYV